MVLLITSYKFILILFPGTFTDVLTNLVRAISFLSIILVEKKNLKQISLSICQSGFRLINVFKTGIR